MTAEQEQCSPSSPGTARDTDRRDTGTGLAHGKVILLGEHAAVYGAPAVALPVPRLGCRARVARRDRGGCGVLGFRLVAAPPGVPAGLTGPLPHTAESPVPEGVVTLTEAVLRQTGLPVLPGVDVHLESGVPLARGLGSSAASARALTLALDDLFGLELSADTVFRYIQLSETAAHGQASGIDAWTTGSSGPVLLAEGRISVPPVRADSWLVVVDSGSGASTKEAVGMLRQRLSRDPARRESFLDRSAALTRQALLDLERGHLESLGRRLTDCHALLAGLKLTTQCTDHLVEAALRAGALGAKMTGGGLGGCVIALTTTEHAADALAAHFVREHSLRSWTAPLPRGEGHVRS
ncbi:mevalonate kinase [Streptomyces sp. NPDC023327]|uniref:mevalonate kinase n=1 Tax=Streptomyces sp. NPDC023327 TaxID=3157088 RepID=UPI0034013D65